MKERSDSTVIWAQFTAPEGGEKALLDFLASAARRARGEAGCLEYRIYRSGSDAPQFFVHETWQDEDTLAAHRQKDYVRSFREGVAPLLAQPYAVTVVRPTGA